MYASATFLRAVLRATGCVGLILAVGLGVLGTAVPARAFTNEVPAGTTTLRLNQIPSLQSFLNAIGAGSFGNTPIANVQVTDTSISGDLNLLALQWNFLLFKAGTAGSESYIALEPKRTFKFSELFSNVPGMGLVDIMQFDRQVLVFSARDTELQENSLPAVAKAFFQPYFGSGVMNVNFSQGLTMYAALDLGKVPTLKSAIEFIGGRSSVVRLRGAMATNILGSLAQGQKPVPSLQMAAALPTVRPTIGGKITLPVDFTIGLQSELSPTNVKMGYLAEADFPFAYPNVATKNISTARTRMGLEVNMELGLDSPVPTFGVQTTMFKGEAGAFKQAFGIPFLTLQDYVTSFEQAGDAIAIGVGAGGKFYDKNIESFASVQIRASTSGLPIPQSLKLMITPDNPNQIASVSLFDLGRAFVDLTAAVTGQRLNLPQIPEDFVKVSGMRAGEGPFIDASLDIGLDAGLEAAGNLVVFGKTLAEVETAVIKPTHGVEIKAKNNGIGLGDYVQMPTATIDVALTVDNLTDPRVHIRGTTQEILGSVGIMEVAINKDKQVGIIEGHAPFKAFEATLILESNTRSLTNPNFTATGIIEGDFFNKLADGLTNATADLVKGTESVVAAMNEEIHTFSQRLTQTKIDKSKAVTDLENARRSAYAAFESAKAEVDRLKKKYEDEEDDCSPAPWDWDNCIAAGAIWTAWQTAKGVLSVAQKGVDAFLAGTGAALSKVIDGLNATIATLGQAIDVASQALGRAAVTFTKALDVAAQLAGKALDAVATVFDIEKLWMQGQLAILQGQQKGELGVQYTLMSKEYLKSVNWDFRVPVDEIVKVFKPGSQGAPAPVVVEAKYSYAPSTTAIARNAANTLLNEGTLRAVTVPFDPNICVKEPYAIDQQLADLKSEKEKIGNLKLNAQAYAYVMAAESSSAFRAMQSNPNGANLSWSPDAMMMGLIAFLPQAVIGGQESGRALPVCRANHNNGWHPGKFVAGNCNTSYAGKEVVSSKFQLLIGSGASWVAASNGQVPPGAFIGGQEPGRSLPICRAPYAGGVHPGKLVGANCNIGYGGKEILVRNYEVMIGSVLSAQQKQAYPTIVSSYKTGKAAVAERTFTPERVTNLRNVVANMNNALNALPANDSVRAQMAAFISRPSTQEANLNPQFLLTQENDLTVTIASLEKLKRDPASPCGKVAQQAGLQAPAAPQPAVQAQPRGMGNVFQQVQQAMQQAQQAAILAAQKAAQQTQQAVQQAQAQAQAQNSAFAVEAAAAAAALAQKQKTEAQQRIDALKKQQAMAFLEKLKQHKAKADAAAQKSDKLENRLEQIKPKLEMVNTQKKQQLAADAALAAQKANALARISQVQATPALRPTTAPGVVPRATMAARSTARGASQPAVVFTPKPLMNLPPAIRAAFAREFAAEQAAAVGTPNPASGPAPAARSAATAPAANANLVAQVAKVRAAAVQKLQATPEAKNLPADLAPSAVLGSEAKADAMDKAALLKATTRLVGRQSQIPGAPNSVATRPSSQQESDVSPVANVDNRYLNNLRLLRDIPR